MSNGRHPNKRKDERRYRPDQDLSPQHNQEHRRGNNRTAGGQSSRHGRPFHTQATDRESPQRPADSTFTSDAYWSFENIKEIAHLSSQAIVDRVHNEQRAFVRAFQHDGNIRKIYVLQWLVKVLYGLSNASEPSNIAFGGRMISQIFSDCPAFMMKLNEYIQKSDSSDQLIPLVSIGRFCIENIPQSTVFTFPQSQLREAVTSQQDGDALKVIFATYDERFQDIKAALLEERHSKKRTCADTQTQEVNPHDLKPPDDFHGIEILPQPNEIKNVHEKLFFRPNLIRGTYHDWDHYLDVQFRLLREDFMGPLREVSTTFFREYSVTLVYSSTQEYVF